MFSFLVHKQPYKIISVCIVTSSVVTTAVVKLFTNKGSAQKPIVLFSHEIPIFTQGGTLNQITGETLQSVKKSLSACHHMEGRYDEHICMVGEPWMTSVTRTITQEKNKSFYITETLVKDLILRDLAKYKEEQKKSIEDEGLEVVEPGKPLVDVNGYRVGRLEKMKGEKLAIAYLAGTFPQEFKKSLSNLYEQVFHTSKVTFTAIDYAYYHALDAVSWDHALMLLVGGISSSLIYFERGIPQEIQVIPFGILDIKRNIMSAFEVSEKHIEQVVAFTHDEQLLTHKRDVYIKRLIEAQQEWGNALEESYTHIKKRMHQRPPHIILVEPVSWFSLYHATLEVILERRVVSPYGHLLQKMIFTHEAPQSSPLLALGIAWVLYNCS